MKCGVPAVLLAAVLTVSGCAGRAVSLPADDDEPSATVAAPVYDGTLEPAAAVLALVPDAATSLTVTDYGRVRAELGMDPVGSAADQAAFWRAAEQQRPMLGAGVLEKGPLSEQYGAAVAWEAHFYGADDAPLGWVLGLHEDADLAGLTRAAAQADGPLAGATVDAARRVVTSGAATDPQASWASVAGMADLVGLPANTTYVARDCLTGVAGNETLDRLEQPWSVQFEGTLATARLGAGRRDLFDRMRLALADPAFAQAWSGGVADPRTGRIGYVMTDPAAAAQDAVRHELPFAACGE